MPRKNRGIKREGWQTKDADLIVIASEDKFAVQEYFERFKTRRVRFEVLPTEDCNSSPSHVIERLIEYIDEPGNDADSLWLCVDRDRWGIDHLRSVLDQCRQRGFQTAISTPCFDLWMLLHFEERGQTDFPNCDAVISHLKLLLSGYAKRCCRNHDVTGEMVAKATERARALDNGEYIPTTPSTGVYRIIDLLLEKDRIEFT